MRRRKGGNVIPSSFLLCEKSSIRREDAALNQADSDCHNAVSDLGFDKQA